MKATSRKLATAFIILLPLVTLPTLKIFHLNHWLGIRANFTQQFILIAVLIAPIIEESVFRGLLPELLNNLVKQPLIRYLISNLGFCLSHYHINHNPFYLAGVFISGIIFSYIRIISNKISPAILTHAYYNLLFIIFFI